MKLTILILLLLVTPVLAQNMLTGSLEYQQKPVERFDATINAHTIQHEQKLSARLSAAYKIKDVEITSVSTISLSDVRDMSVLLNFTVPLP